MSWNTYSLVRLWPYSTFYPSENSTYDQESNSETILCMISQNWGPFLSHVNLNTLFINSYLSMIFLLVFSAPNHRNSPYIVAKFQIPSPKPRRKICILICTTWTWYCWTFHALCGMWSSSSKQVILIYQYVTKRK